MRLKQEVEGGDGRKSLEVVTSLAVAQPALLKLKPQRDDKALPTLKRGAEVFGLRSAVPRFSPAGSSWQTRGHLRVGGIPFDSWAAHFGETRVDQINRAKLDAFIAKRPTKGVTGWNATQSAPPGKLCQLPGTILPGSCARGGNQPCKA